MAIKKKTKRWVGGIFAGLFCLWLSFVGYIDWAMRQPPEVFGHVMQKCRCLPTFSSPLRRCCALRLEQCLPCYPLYSSFHESAITRVQALHLPGHHLFPIQENEHCRGYVPNACRYIRHALKQAQMGSYGPQFVAV
jgi:hypothetical protein